MCVLGVVVLCSAMGRDRAQILILLLGTDIGITTPVKNFNTWWIIQNIMAFPWGMPKGNKNITATYLGNTFIPP